MRRLLTVLFTAALALGLTASAVFAQSPRWNRGPTYDATTSSLTSSGKATGLGNEPVEALLHADKVEVHYQCRNRGENYAGGHPATFENVENKSEPIDPRNGQITFRVSLMAPVPSAADVCPNRNWQVIVSRVDYLGVYTAILDGDGNVVLRDPAAPPDYNCSSTTGTCT
jgi:hypothetical protein